MKGIVKKAFRLGSIGILTLVAQQAFASGFKLEMQSSSVLADSGDAAVVEDAGTNWYNSAGLVYLPQQIVGSAIDVYSDTTFRGSVAAPNIYTGIIPSSLAPNFFGSGKSVSHPNSILPAIHYSLPFMVKDQQFAFGISIAPAWGLVEDYGSTSFTRYNLTRIYTKTLDIAPSLAYKINNHWSVGAGPDFHYFSLSTTSHVNTSNLIGAPTAPGGSGDSIARSQGDSWNYGGHIGVLYRYSDTTRYGINYRSQIIQDTSGTSAFQFSGVGPDFETSAFRLKLVLPATTSLSFYHDIDCHWAIMGTAAFDQWSSIRYLDAKGYMEPTGTTINANLPQKFRNTIDLGLGAHLTLNDMWMLRANVKYEPTPTVNQYRDLNFPDADKLGFQVGARGHVTKKLLLDVFYGHVFTRQATINNTNIVTFVTTNGHVNTSLDIVGAQLVYDI